MTLADQVDTLEQTNELLKQRNTFLEARERNLEKAHAEAKQEIERLNALLPEKDRRRGAVVSWEALSPGDVIDVYFKPGGLRNDIKEATVDSVQDFICYVKDENAFWVSDAVQPGATFPEEIRLVKKAEAEEKELPTRNGGIIRVTVFEGESCNILAEYCSECNDWDSAYDDPFPNGLTYALAHEIDEWEYEDA